MSSISSKTVEHVEHIEQNCRNINLSVLYCKMVAISTYRSCTTKLSSYQAYQAFAAPLEHLLKNYCSVEPVLIWLVHRREWWGAWPKKLLDSLTVQQFWIICLICLTVLQYRVNRSILRKFCSTGLICHYCESFAVQG